LNPLEIPGKASNCNNLRILRMHFHMHFLPQLSNKLEDNTNRCWKKITIMLEIITITDDSGFRI